MRVLFYLLVYMCSLIFIRVIVFKLRIKQLQTPHKLLNQVVLLHDKYFLVILWCKESNLIFFALSGRIIFETYLVHKVIGIAEHIFDKNKSERSLKFIYTHSVEIYCFNQVFNTALTESQRHKQSWRGKLCKQHLIDHFKYNVLHRREVKSFQC